MQTERLSSTRNRANDRHSATLFAVAARLILNRFSILICLTVLLAVSLGAPFTSQTYAGIAASVPMQTGGACGPLIQEGEAGMLNGSFAVGNDAAASGGQYAHVPVGGPGASSPGSSHRVSHCFNVTQAGTYQIKAWVYAASGLSDSFFVGVNGQNYLWDFPINTTYNQHYVTNRGVSGPVQITLPIGNVQVIFYVRESGARLDKIQLELIGAPANQAPVANVGLYGVIADTNGVPGETVQLNGSASFDPDGTITTYNWTVNGAPLNQNTATPTANLNDGMNTVSLMVIDNQGAASIASATTITVNAPGQSGYQTPANCVQTLGPWQQMAPAPANHIEGAVAAVNGRLYIFSGFASINPLASGNRMDVYNPATNIWESAVMPFGPTPFSLSHTQAAADGPYIWIAGGFIGPSGGPPTNGVWRYNTLTDTWTPGPALPAPRASGALVIAGRNLHYIGGLSADRQTDYADHWILNLDNPVSWVNAVPMARPRNHFPAVTINGIIYAIGGQSGHDGPHIDVNWLDAYNPATNTWQQRANLAVRRSHSEPSTFVVNERIVTVGGRSWDLGSPIDRVTQYNPQTNTWNELRPLPVPLIAPAAVHIGNYVIVSAGGVAWDSPQKNTWIAEVQGNCSPPAPVNQPPVANVGTYSVVADSNGQSGESVQLNGTGSYDPNGTITTYNWTVNGSPLNQNTPTPTANLNDGANTVSLVVIDNQGAASIPSATTITVSAPATSGASGVCGPLLQEGEAGTLNGAFAVGNDVAASGGQYAHVPVGGPGASSPGSSHRVTHCFNVTQAGTYQIRAWVYAASISSDSFFVGVNGVNYLWDFPVNTTYNPYYVTNRGVSGPVQIALPVGDVQVIFYVRETGARLDRIQLERVGAPVNQPPVANVGTYSVVADSNGQPGESVQLSGAGSYDPDGTIVTYNWTVNGSSLNQNTPTPTASLNDGANTVSLVVIDNQGAASIPSATTITVSAPSTGNNNPSARILITSNQSGWTVSTYSSNAFQITNTGDIDITRVFFNLTTTYMPDIVFDPQGYGGDSAAKCFEANSGAVTVGLVPVANNCTTPFSLPNPVVPGDPHPNAGYFGMTINFTDFNANETFGFSVDIDPTSIKGDTTSGDAGSVSGMELIGATVTVTFSDGTIVAAPIWLDATQSNGGGRAIAAPNAPVGPSIAVQGIAVTPIVVSNPAQSIVITGPPSASYTLLQVDARLHIDSGGGGYDIEPFEANESVAKNVFNGTLNGSGIAVVPVTLLRTAGSGGAPVAGLNHFIAVINGANGQASSTSNVIVLHYDPSAPAPVNQPPVANVGTYSVVADSNGQPGESVQLSGAGSYDPDGTIVTYNWTVNGSSLNQNMPTPTANLNDGANTVSLVVIDNQGAASIPSATTITVSAPTAGGSCGPLLQEGEAGTLNGAFVVGNDAAASGGQYAHVPVGGPGASSPGSSHRVTHCFNVTQAGTYQIRAWVYAASISSDSFFVGVNGVNYLWDFPVNTTYNPYYVTNRGVSGPVQIALPVGNVQVIFYVRETGARLDRIQLERVGG